jgi:hypothetical protein
LNKAQSLGWKTEQIRVLDRDLGQSGAAATKRADFKVSVPTHSDQPFRLIPISGSD